MYYKRMQNGTVTDVIEAARFVRRQQKHGLILPCGETDADGVQTQDGAVYRIDGRPALPAETFETVYPIDRAQYLTLADQLGKTVEPVIGDVEILRGQLREQTQRNDFLEDCLLEMSEVVYG